MEGRNTIEELEKMLICEGEEENQLYRKAKEIKNRTIGNKVYLRGLIEISNICTKDCFYCGIRKSNTETARYALSDEEILDAADFAYTHRFGSIVLQGGERSDREFTERITRLLKEIKKNSRNELGITLSLGEQTGDTYKRWFEAGAHRYLLRIETSNPELYAKIHPNNALHSHATRLKCLEMLQRCGYQTGTGVMIGLPFQTITDLANDLLFLQSMDIDMVGMGPYLEHHATPLYQYRHLLLPLKERLRLSIHMVAALRILMPDINIAATTALQAIEENGREKALEIGANVVMPNITPTSNRTLYKLYENKPGTHEGAAESMRKLEESILKSGCEVAYGAWGDSRHFQIKANNTSSSPFQPLA
ncbi:[FeFe] hydrogenase H-cluster radical SAM maturase HydE [Butyricimonas synergistica]|uniref:[FeFe] hydrogenase H-cluster radical SAM maturase HydE n=1 Tax=Butyricimonas synergistica TaxID=544644 RepID=UPI0003738EAE|nr:[FeFe] hydrogenase H-cluster radical SAM maturase HydE [Butyricimonas synergistica]